MNSDLAVLTKQLIVLPVKYKKTTVYYLLHNVLITLAFGSISYVQNTVKATELLSVVLVGTVLSQLMLSPNWCEIWSQLVLSLEFWLKMCFVRSLTFDHKFKSVHP